MVIHDTECPYRDQVSFNSTKPNQTQARVSSPFNLNKLRTSPMCYVTVLSYTSIQQQRSHLLISHIDFIFTDIRKFYHHVCLENKT